MNPFVARLAIAHVVVAVELLKTASLEVGHRLAVDERRWRRVSAGNGIERRRRRPCWRDPSLSLPDLQRRSARMTKLRIKQRMMDLLEASWSAVWSLLTSAKHWLRI